MFYKEITKEETRKYSPITYLIALSNRTRKQVGRGWVPQKKMNMYIFKAKKGKQYQNNGTESLFVITIYLIELFEMRLLRIAESFESPKKSKSTFK